MRDYTIMYMYMYIDLQIHTYKSTNLWQLLLRRAAWKQPALLRRSGQEFYLRRSAEEIRVKGIYNLTQIRGGAFLWRSLESPFSPGHLET